MALFKKPVVIVWRWDATFQNGIPCGTVLNSGREDHNPNRIWLQCRSEGTLPHKETIRNIPDEGGMVTIDNRILPGLGRNRVIIVVASNESNSSPVGDFLGYLSGEIANKLSASKEAEEAADAAKHIEATERREGESATVERWIAQYKKMKAAEGFGWQPGRRPTPGE